VNDYRLYGSNTCDGSCSYLIVVRFDMSPEEVHTLLILMDKSDRDCDSVKRCWMNISPTWTCELGNCGDLKDPLTSLRRKCQGQNKMRDCRIPQTLWTMRATKNRGRTFSKSRIRGAHSLSVDRVATSGCACGNALHVCRRVERTTSKFSVFRCFQIARPSTLTI
jgi:hypothetical protein